MLNRVVLCLSTTLNADQGHLRLKLTTFQGIFLTAVLSLLTAVMVGISCLTTRFQRVSGVAVT